MKTYEPRLAPSYAAKIRVEVYIPRRHARPYRTILNWLIDELTEVRGGCTVHENASGYYYMDDKEIADERMSVIYSDFSFDWNDLHERAYVLGYCATLKEFLFDNLSEEEILISAYPVSHVSQ